MSIIREYYQNFTEVFGDHGGTIMFLSSIATYGYTFFREANLYQDCPIAIITDGSHSTIANLGDGFQKGRIRLDGPQDTVRDAINTRKDNVCLLQFNSSKNTLQNAQSVIESMEYEHSLSILYFEFQVIIPEGFSNGFIPVDVSCENLTDANQLLCRWKNEVIGFMTENYPNIRICLENFAGRLNRQRECEWLFAAIEVASMMEGDTSSGYQFAAELKTSLEDALDASDELICEDDLYEKALAYLKLYVAKHTAAMVDIRHAMTLDELDSGKIFFDESHIYVCDANFNSAFSSLLSTASMAQINSALANHGVQKSEKQGTRRNYTPKKKVRLVDGTEKRSRFHAIYREKVLGVVHEKKQTDLTCRDEMPDSQTVRIATDCEHTDYEKENPIIGITQEGKQVMLSPDSMNRHILITGISGSGKSTMTQRLMIELAEKGNLVFALNINGCFDQEHVYEGCRSKFDNLTNHISIRKEGMPFTIWPTHEDGEDHTEEDCGRVLSVLISSVKGVLGSRQIAYLRRQLKQAYSKRSNHADQLQCLKDILTDDDSRQSISIQDRLYEVLNLVQFRDGMQFEAGRIHVFDIDFDSSARKKVANMLLGLLWGYAMERDSKTDPMYIVLDEFQNYWLTDSDYCILASLLREARKYNVGVILATQTFGTFNKTQKSILDQVATKIFFRQNATDAREIEKDCADVRTLDGNGSLGKCLKDLSVGQCVVVGNLCTANGETERLVLAENRI